MTPTISTMACAPACSAVDDLKVMPLTAEMIAEIARHYPALDDDRRGAELVRELISYLIGAVVSEARRRLDAAQPQSVDDVRNHGDVADRVSGRRGAGRGRDQGVPEAAGCTAIRG